MKLGMDNYNYNSGDYNKYNGSNTNQQNNDQYAGEYKEQDMHTESAEYNQNNEYNSQYDNGYNQQYQHQPELEEVMPWTRCLLYEVLLVIPIVNIIFMFIWAFGNTDMVNKTWSNASKAYLVIMLVAVIIGAIFGMLILFISASVINSVVQTLEDMPQGVWY